MKISTPNLSSLTFELNNLNKSHVFPRVDFYRKLFCCFIQLFLLFKISATKIPVSLSTLLNTFTTQFTGNGTLASKLEQQVLCLVLNNQKSFIINLRIANGIKFMNSLPFKVLGPVPLCGGTRSTSLGNHVRWGQASVRAQLLIWGHGKAKKCVVLPEWNIKLITNVIYNEGKRG